MQRVERTWIPLFVLVGVTIVFAAACTQQTHDEHVAELRSKYEASLNGFVVEQEPVASMEAQPAEGETMEGEAVQEMGEGEATPPQDEGGAMAEGGETTSEGAEGMTEPEAPLRQDVLLDIVIRHDSPERLPGITVDISMADGERELQTWRVYFDTSRLSKGPGVQYSHTLEDVDYEPGYGFSAEIRSPVPPEERHLYKEFSESE